VRRVSHNEYLVAQRSRRDEEAIQVHRPDDFHKLADEKRRLEEGTQLEVVKSAPV
jgi:hypothetical protein